ncbi:MAG TPA: tRNA (N6-threonylcarbamoyladenosine(37)-N6)-methyltransferase TrmO [Longimicrobiales bacterium]
MNAPHTLQPIGRVSSSIMTREDAPRQGDEGAPPAWLEFEPAYEAGLRDLATGDEILVITWLHRADRTTLRVYPRGDRERGLRGVFSTRSPDRPNPIGIHRVHILEMDSALRFLVSNMEAIDGTPIVDIKPVLKPQPR